VSRLVLQSGDREYVATGDPVDISIPLRFDGPQPGFFGADAATARPMHAGDFIGDTRLGGSCNAEHLDLIPHCNGTHTECIGHITNERIAVNDMAMRALYLAQVVTIATAPAGEVHEQDWQKPSKKDRLITQDALHKALTDADLSAVDALIIRTLPNDKEKTRREWPIDQTPYFSVEAMRWIVERNVRHLLVDTPSVDRLDDAHLDAHRIFWGLASGSRSVHDATRAHATITEMIYVPDRIDDGLHLLALQIAPFVSDAAPSRPLLYRIAA